MLIPGERFIILKAGIQDKLYILVNIYASNKDTVSGKFYKNLNRVLQTEDLDCEENIIIGGDFNCPLDPKLDKKDGIMVPRKMVIDNIECLQNELDLVDVWRIKNPQSRSYTWSQKSPPIFCRLDYWLISNNLQDFVNTTDIIPAIKTDHAAIELNLTDSNQNSKRARLLENERLSSRRSELFGRIKYLLLAEFSVRTVNYGPRFFPSIYGKRAGHKSTEEKTRICSLQYGPKKRG